MECARCEVLFLDPFPSVDYASGDYRQNYNASVDIVDYYRLHDREQPGYLSILAEVPFRERVVGDFGCGGGAFLDHVRGVASQTVAVEPFTGYHPELRRKGHRVYAAAADMFADPECPKIHVGVSVHVVEHVAGPVDHLKAIRKVMDREGILIVGTPNSGEIMMRLGLPEYRPFYFRTAHLWYFNSRSLQWVARRAGFKVVKVFYRHTFDLSNVLCWLRDRRPTGTGRIDLLDGRVNAAWGTFLEDKGLADTVWVVLKK